MELIRERFSRFRFRHADLSLMDNTAAALPCAGRIARFAAVICAPDSRHCRPRTATFRILQRGNSPAFRGVRQVRPPCRCSARDKGANLNPRQIDKPPGGGFNSIYSRKPTAIQFPRAGQMHLGFDTTVSSSSDRFACALYLRELHGNGRLRAFGGAEATCIAVTFLDKDRKCFAVYGMTTRVDYDWGLRRTTDPNLPVVGVHSKMADSGSGARPAAVFHVDYSNNGRCSAKLQGF